VDVVLQPIREQKPLGSIYSIDESLHAEHPSTGTQIMPVEAGFSHSLGRNRPVAPRTHLRLRLLFFLEVLGYVTLFRGQPFPETWDWVQ